MIEKRNFLARLGKKFLDSLEVLGRLSMFSVNSVKNIFGRPFYLKQLFIQCLSIGYYSLPVVAMTTVFTGMALALQTYSGFSRFSAEGAVATVVVLGITRELAPVMAGLMVAGRVGAAIAAEIGTMKVTEQIDALTTLSTNPYKYLVVPRVIAGTIMLPVLVLIGDVFGVMGGFLVGVYNLDFNPANYIRNTVEYLEPMDVYSGLIKAAVFGFIVSLMGCYHGYNSRGGAQGVGSATTNAVVSASILILIANYIVTDLLF
ncbi:MAG: ABC transporter permease [Alphaproteobacteria bacterium]|jgi:phospholipid/cholesterol/gamma-HCH transport system permease protein|nr:ABC transporter permease [Alphaproteobacteria bacterium]MCV6599023.1 ABC transporter permease [Alphaproteobacteria bacterium]